VKNNGRKSQNKKTAAFQRNAIRCDELISIQKTRLTDYTGALSEEKLIELRQSLSIAIGVDD